MDVTAYNEREGRELGWKWALPALERANALLGMERVLVSGIRTCAPATIERGIRELQAGLGLDIDSALGPLTWAAYCRANRAAHPVSSPHLRIAGCRVPVVPAAGVVIEHPPRDLFDHTGGLREDMNGVVLHWGGVDRASCANALNARKLSSHLLVEGDLDPQGRLLVTQACDLAKVAWHAPPMNRWVVGLDICRSPSLKTRGRYPNAPVVENRTGRGNLQVVGLEDAYAARVRSAIWMVGAALGISRHENPGVAEFTEAQRAAYKRSGGVIAHCNVSPPSERWDVAPWMDRLF